LLDNTIQLNCATCNKFVLWKIITFFHGSLSIFLHKDYMPCVKSNSLFNSHFTTSGYWYVHCNWL